MNSFLKKEQTYLRELPLLNFTASLYSKINLQDVCLICAQHLVSTSYSLFHLLLQLGLKPFNLSAIGKCYSSDPEAISEMQKLGIDVCPSSLTFNSYDSFDRQYRSNIKRFVEKNASKLKDNQFKKIIILDDGGDLLLEVNSILGNDPRVIGIEQTSSGYHKIKQYYLNYPVINVARSPVKLNDESPIIAKLFFDALIRNLTTLSFNFGKVLIIGNGPIGSHIREVLKNDYEVFIYDKMSHKSDIKEEEFEKSLKEFDLIIGCTGTSALTIEHFKLLKKGAILVSASSSDREFNAKNLRIKIPPVNDCHKNLLIEDKWLINCGFPINFSSDFRAIDCDELQLTRSLLLSAILQAVNNECCFEKKIIPLDLRVQQYILQKYCSLFQKNSKGVKYE